MKKVTRETFLTLPEGTVYLEERADGELVLAVKGKSYNPPRKVFRENGKQEPVFFHKGQWMSTPWTAPGEQAIANTLKYGISRPVSTLQESYLVFERWDLDHYIQTLQHFLKHYPIHSSGVVLSGNECN